MQVIPREYHWLFDLALPRIVEEALKEYGTLEVAGAGDNPKILAWAKEVGGHVGIDYTHDSVPWCGLFVGLAAKRAGFIPPEICVRASSWDAWGNDVGGPRAVGAVALGDILRFQRPGGGHVGIYIGEDSAAFHVLGGNQSDSVNITRISKSRLIEARRCPWKNAQPESVRPYHLQATGNISQNEV